MKATSAGAVAVTLASAAALLAGCQSGHATASPHPSVSTYNGIESVSNDVVLQRARIALREAKSYHVNGEFADGDDKLTLDFTVTGEDFGGSLGTGEARIEFLSVGGERYVRPNNVPKAVVGRWFTVPADNKEYGDLFRLADIDGMLNFGGRLTEGGPSTVDGISTTAVLEDDDPVVTVYVARIGEPYPIRVATGDSSVLRLNQFGAAVPAMAKPSPDQIFTLPTTHT
jgi:hypothetical protein